MKKIIQIIIVSISIFILPSSICNGQSLSPHATPSAGGYFFAGGNSLSWTLGETFHATLQSSSNLLTQGEQQPYILVKLINLKAFIQGFYIGSGQMNATIDPENRPTLCDTLVLQLADDPDPNHISYSSSAVMNTDGTAAFLFPGIAAGRKFYLALHHRNAMETWSASPVRIINDVSYDFSTAPSQAYGSNQADLGDGNFGLWSGDVSDGVTSGTQDGVIEAADYSELENAVQQVIFAYHVDDITGDHVVEALDYSLIENNVQLVIFLARP